MNIASFGIGLGQREVYMLVEDFVDPPDDKTYTIAVLCYVIDTGQHKWYLPCKDYARLTLNKMPPKLKQEARKINVCLPQDVVQQHAVPHGQDHTGPTRALQLVGPNIGATDGQVALTCQL